jgi:hypothetical protein
LRLINLSEELPSISTDFVNNHFTKLIMMEESEEKSLDGSASQGTSSDRMKILLGEQIRMNEKLELDNETKAIQIKKMLRLLQSTLF